MNLIRQHNRRTIICLSQEGDVFLARMIVLCLRFDGSHTSHLVQTEQLTCDQAQDLRSKAVLLQRYNIFIVEAAKDSSEPRYSLPFSIYALQGSCTQEISRSFTKARPSPYFSKIQLQEEFISSQLTRGPNSH